MTFAAAEARTCSAVMDRLTNATMTVGAVEVAVIFDAAYISAMGGVVDATQPMCLLKTSDVAAQSMVFGTAVTIGGTAYTVRSTQPDGTGLSALMLEVA